MRLSFDKSRRVDMGWLLLWRCDSSIGRHSVYTGLHRRANGAANCIGTTIGAQIISYRKAAILMSAIDKVTNKSEDCFDHFHYQRPVIPADYQTEIFAILELTSECFRVFEKALKAYFGPKDKLEKVRKHSRRVSEFESRIDKIEREMTSRIFRSSLDKAEQLTCASA